MSPCGNAASRRLYAVWTRNARKVCMHACMKMQKKRKILTAGVSRHPAIAEEGPILDNWQENKLQEKPDKTSLFTVEGMDLYPEPVGETKWKLKQKWSGSDKTGTLLRFWSSCGKWRKSVCLITFGMTQMEAKFRGKIHFKEYVIIRSRNGN